MTIWTDVLVETLPVLGAAVRWATCTFFSAQDHAVADVAMDGTVTVFDWNGGTLPEYWWCGDQILTIPGGRMRPSH